MSKIRVLVVDDAVVMRRIVSRLIASDPMLEVVGTAANGNIALARIAQLQPDLVTLDLEMPQMDGLATLRALRKTNQLLPVIMLSRFTERGAAATQEAMKLGANDYVAMPDRPGSTSGAMQRVAEQLIPKIKQLMAGGKNFCALATAQDGASSLTTERLLTRSKQVDVVAIGVSTGGPDALSALLPLLPRQFPVPIVIVQHMPPNFTRRLADQLRSKSAIGVGEAVASELLRPGHAWIAPGDYHMVVVRDKQGVRLEMSQGAPENFCRPSVDVLFRSVADVYGPSALAVVLTGLGKDGLRGCEKIRAAGGQVLVQDQASSVVWGMPGAVAKAGLADQLVPLEQLGTEIIRRVEVGRTSIAPDPVPVH